MSIEINTELVADPARDDDGWEHRLWNITLVNVNDATGEQEGQFKTEYRTGMALGEPSVEDVLESLLMDVQGVRYESVDAWIEGYGFEINSLADARKYEAMYAKIEEQGKALAEFVGGQDVLDSYLDMDSDEAARKLVNL